MSEDLNLSLNKKVYLSEKKFNLPLSLKVLWTAELQRDLRPRKARTSRVHARSGRGRIGHSTRVRRRQRSVGNSRRKSLVAREAMQGKSTVMRVSRGSQVQAPGARASLPV